MQEPDFSGVDPLRLPEVRRRIAALNEYLALPSPTTADAVRFAEAIGLSRWQFQRLAAVWRNHRDPNLIFNGHYGRSRRDYGIAPRTTEIAEAVIADADHDDPVTAIATRIETRCAAEGVAPPSRPTIWNYVRKARAEAPASGPPRIVIGRMWFHLPVADQPADAMPTLLAAVLLPERLIIAHRISTDPQAPPSLLQLVEELAALRTVGAPERQVIIDIDDRPAAEAAMAKTGVALVRGTNPTAQKDLSRSFNGKLGTLNALYRRARARPASRKAATRLERPLDAVDVVAAISGAIASSNAAAMAMAPSSTSPIRATERATTSLWARVAHA